MSKSGKTLTFILVIFIVLLMSVTGISLFFFLKEIDLRQAAEQTIEQLKSEEAKLQTSLKSAQEQIVLLEDRKKEAENKVEGYMQELDLERDLKEEAQKQTQVLQESLQQETQAKEELRARLSQDLAAAQEKYDAVKAELDKALVRTKELEEAKAQIAAKAEKAQQQELKKAPAPGVELGKIVVNSATPSAKGKVISVDSDTDFVIVSLGQKDGVASGSLLSLYRGENYLGDVKVSRVLAEMSAADFVPPLMGQNVKKDDQVVVKK